MTFRYLGLYKKIFSKNKKNIQNVLLLFCDQFIIKYNRVEGRIFYGHKIVLVTASLRLQSMLSSKVNEGNATPTVQINDIRYHIFEVKVYF